MTAGWSPKRATSSNAFLAPRQRSPYYWVQVPADIRCSATSRSCMRGSGMRGRDLSPSRTNWSPRWILAAPVRPATGDLVLLRRDPSGLGVIESGILSRLRADGRLCYLDPGGTEVSGYRFWRHGEPPPGEACADGPDDGSHPAMAEHGEMTALAELIGRMRQAKGPIANGPLDAPARSAEESVFQIPCGASSMSSRSGGLFR